MAASARNPLAARRRKARRYALQALYQWHMAGAEPAAIEAAFRDDHDFGEVDGEYFHALLCGVPARLAAIEAAFRPYLVARAPEELTPVERALLRMATFELLARPDVPYRVVLDEAVALAKKFGAQDAHKFVNAVLDRAARELRRPEIQAPGGRQSAE